MRKSSRSVSLALIGTALALSGCGGKADDEWGEGEELAQAPAGVDPNAQGVATGNGQYHHSGGYYNSPGRTAARVGGAIIGSQIGRNLGGGGGVGPAPGPGYSGGHPGGMAGGATSAPSSRGGFGSSAGHGSGSASS